VERSPRPRRPQLGLSRFARAHDVRTGA
jgi:hypothetical protein